MLIYIIDNIRLFSTFDCVKCSALKPHHTINSLKSLCCQLTVDTTAYYWIIFIINIKR
jgi:hypothetical protein